jgi:hypothetical protein
MAAYEFGGGLGSVSSPRGLMHSAAATIGETNCPVVGSLSMSVAAVSASAATAWPT